MSLRWSYLCFFIRQCRLLNYKHELSVDTLKWAVALYDPGYSPLSGYTEVVTRHRAGAGSSLNDLQLFVLPQQRLRSPRDKTFTRWTNDHRSHTVDVTLTKAAIILSKALLKTYHNKEMILIKEVMVNTHTQTSTHTPLSVLTFKSCGIGLHVEGKFLLPGACFDLVFKILTRKESVSRLSFFSFTCFPLNTFKSKHAAAM